MSDDMIERVAREMQSLSLTSGDMIEQESQAAYLVMARVAIAAMLPVEVRCPHCESWFKPEDIERDKQ